MSVSEAMTEDFVSSKPSIFVVPDVSPDLIDFSESDNTAQSLRRPECLSGSQSDSSGEHRQRKISPVLQRVLLSDIKYSRPVHVPAYTPDDFIRTSPDEVRESSPSDLESTNNSLRRSSAPDLSTRSSVSTRLTLCPENVCSEIGCEPGVPVPEPALQPNPPEPPSRTRRLDSDLADRLRKAGISVADAIIKTARKANSRILQHSSSADDLPRSSPVISSAEKASSARAQSCNASPTASPLAQRATGFDDFMRTQNFETRLKYALNQKQEDFLNRNLCELDVPVNGARPFNIATHETKSLNELYGHNKHVGGTNSEMRQQVMSLSLEDLVRFEGGDVSDDSLDDARSVSKPPPRPPPPKGNNRFSCPAGLGTSPVSAEDISAVFFGDGMLELAEERNEEAVAFCQSIADLRRLYVHTDRHTNPGYVAAPVMKNNCLKKNPELSIEAIVYLDPFQTTVELTFRLTLCASEATALCLAAFQGSFSDLDVLSDAYVLKPCGFAMYMSGATPLGDYLHVQDCIKQERKLKLVLLKTNQMNVELCRDQDDDMEDGRGTYFKHFFELPSSLSISQQGLTVLLDAYNAEAARLLSEVSQTFEAKYMPERLIQSVKAISNSLATLETPQIQEAVNLLLSLKGARDTRRTYSVNPHKAQDFNRYINPMHFDKGRFQHALEKLTAGVHHLIELYCKAFNTDFVLLDRQQRNGEDEESYERIDSRTLTDNFSFKIASVHRIPVDWKTTFDYFEFECGLFYGGKLLCAPVRSKMTRPCMGFFEHISFEDLLVFSVPVKDIPREAKLGIVLRGLTGPKKGTDGRAVLGWLSCNLYNYKSFFISGASLFGLLSSVSFNPAATCATNHIQKKDTVIVKLDFQVYHTEVVFPEPILLDTTAEPREQLSPDDLEKLCLERALLRDPCELSAGEKRLAWKFRSLLCRVPRALPHVLASAPDWTSPTVLEVHRLLSCWEALKPHDALELLQADYPDKNVRSAAVLWLSKISTDDLLNILPQLTHVLKYEHYHNSSLAIFLIQRALEDPGVAHFLFWHLKYHTSDVQFCQRFQIILGGLLSVVGARMRDQLSRQDELVQKLSIIAQRIKDTKEPNRKYQLLWELETLSKNTDSCFRMPINPSLKVLNVLPAESSYFGSFTVPLKVAFANADARGVEVDVIFKVGDDLRKDLVTLLLFRVMNKLWLLEGLDLRMIIYEVLPTGPLTGIIEIVHDAATFREIHVQHGLTGSFKDDSLVLWLEKFTSSERPFDSSIRNFTASAAGYCVATYVLGIGDRHNDNIMLTRSGHLFHIDFSKFLGNVQKFANIRRDRVPFVLTPDMAYVINRGVTPTANFQLFIDYCCQAFNILRRNSKVILNLLGLMVHSGISYLSQREDLDYVRDALKLNLSDGEATVYFTRLIESSLSSRSTQLNFFIHNVAQMKSSSDTLSSASSSSSPLFSFSNKVCGLEEDGEIVSARVVDFQKRYCPDKHYVFVVNVLRKGFEKPVFVFRKYEHFVELHGKLGWVFNAFSNTSLPYFPTRFVLGRSQIREVAFRRRAELDRYMFGLSELPNVFRSEIFYTFCHSYMKDMEDERQFSDISFLQEMGGHTSRIAGEIKISLHYAGHKFKVLIMHVRGLIPRRVQGFADPYVKTYLLPDPDKSTKRKTKVVRKTLNPTFNESLAYQFPLDFMQRRVLQVSVWDRDALRFNEFLGGVNFYLSTFDLTVERTAWFKLVNLGLGEREFFSSI